MISTNIDGSSANGNPLMDLLKIVANPDAYAAKVKDMDEATARYNAAIALAGPASEIIAIRERIAEDNKASKDALAEAKKKAAQIVSDAERKASVVVDDALLKAAKIVEDAQNQQASAVATQNAANNAASAAAAREAEAGKKADAAEKLSEKLKAEIAAAKKELAVAIALKDEIVAKHKAFIESLG